MLLNCMEVGTDRKGVILDDGENGLIWETEKLSCF